MVLAIARAASDGLAAGVKVTVGMILATLFVMCAVWAVLFGLIHLSDSALKVLRVVGVIVLALIALSLLKPVPHQTTARASIPTSIPLRRRVLMGDLTGGLLTGLTSPVHLLFILALVPQFVDMNRATPAQLALITGGILLITAIPMVAVSLISARSGRFGLRWALGVRRAGGLLLLGFTGLALIGSLP